MNLQRRVAFALLSIVALFVAVQGILAYLSLYEQEDDLVEDLVFAEARRLAARAERGELTTNSDRALFTPSPDLRVWLVGADGRAAPDALPAHLQALDDGPHRPVLPGKELHVIVLKTAAGRLLVQYDAEQNEAKVRAFGLYLLTLGALCVALGAVVALRLAKVVVAPIERLTNLLSDWVPDAPLRRATRSDEESRLLDAFGRVQGRFEAVIAREREFVDNLRHEVRTPLAALRTDLEMLALSVPPESDEHARIRRATDSVDAVASALESARALSRRRQSESTSVELCRLVDDAWSSLGSYPASRELRFRNAVPGTVRVAGDRHALLTILRNLFRNAAEHAAPALCTVRWSDATLVVSDDGPGIAAADLPFIFERYYRGRLTDAPGHAQDGERGLGLAIARQVADLHGWQLSVASDVGRGTRFYLTLTVIAAAATAPRLD